MRETCARVLAAALMTGAIATVVWMSALAGTPNETTRPLAAPAPPPARSVTIRVQPVRAAPEKPTQPIRRAPAVADVAGATAVIARPLAASHPRRAKRPVRQLASTHRAPAAAASTPAAPAVTEAPTAPALEPLDEHGNGHAHGHDKARGKGHERHED